MLQKNIPENMTESIDDAQFEPFRKKKNDNMTLCGKHKNWQKAIYHTICAY